MFKRVVLGIIIYWITSICFTQSAGQCVCENDQFRSLCNEAGKDLFTMGYSTILSSFVQFASKVFVDNNYDAGLLFS